MRKTNANKIGPFTLSKKGLPTVRLSPLVASAKTGKIVPHKVIKATDKNKTFCSKKILSRDNSESNFARLLSVSIRVINMINDPTNVTAMKIKKSQPIVDWAKECTDGTGPPLFINIPI